MTYEEAVRITEAIETELDSSTEPKKLVVIGKRLGSLRAWWLEHQVLECRFINSLNKSEKNLRLALREIANVQ